MDARPSVDVFFSELTTLYKGVLIAAGVLTVLTVLIGFKMLFDITRKVKNDDVQADLYWILCSPMIVSIMCLLGLIFPRVSDVIYYVGMITLAFAMTTLCALMIRLCGGRKTLCESSHGKTMTLRGRINCFGCCPNIDPTESNLRILVGFVHQLPVVRGAFAIAIIIIGFEGGKSTIISVLGIAGFISSILGIAAVQTISNFTAEYVEPTKVARIFRLIALIHLLYSLLHTILRIVAVTGGLSAPHPLSPIVAAGFWFNSALILGIFVLSISLAVTAHPGNSTLFVSAAFLVQNRSQQVNVELPRSNGHREEVWSADGQMYAGHSYAHYTA